MGEANSGAEIIGTKHDVGDVFGLLGAVYPAYAVLKILYSTVPTLPSPQKSVRASAQWRKHRVLAVGRQSRIVPSLFRAVELP